MKRSIHSFSGLLRAFSMFMMLLSFGLAAGAQETLQITGKVTDSTNTPLVGVTVQVKGDKQSKTTDKNGDYAINATRNATLIFSYIGYEKKEVNVGGQLTLNVLLTYTSTALDEVVVVGYGTQKKINLTGSIATITGKQIRDLPVSNLSNALAGRLAGVRINQTGGAPMKSSSVNIRAIGTRNNSSPLYVIDGVVKDQFAFDALDPSEVADLSVLKDGASASVYGSRAANGVILVTTKTGTTGKAVISYSGSVGIDKAIKIPRMQNALEHGIFINDALTVRKIDTSDVRYYSQDELEYYKSHGTNDHLWIDEAWRNPITTRHALNVSGGSANIRYFINGTFYNATGAFNKINFRKYSLRSSIEADITKDLTASLNLSTNVRNDSKPFWLYDDDDDNMPDLYKAFLFRPSETPPYINGLLNGTFVDWSPVAITDGLSGYNRKKYSDLNAIVSLEYKIPFVEGLKLKAMFNNNAQHTFIKQFSLPYTLNNFQRAGFHNHIVTDKFVDTKIRDDGEFLVESYNNPSSYQFDGYLTYDRDFGKHSFSGLMVYEQAESSQDYFSAERDNFISPTVDQLFAGSPNSQFAYGNGSESGRKSVIGRFNYNYASRYILTAAFRYDGSVKFAPGKRWGFFPSLSGAWRISDEPFFKNISWVNSLKLRGSVGLVGNDDVGGYQFIQQYNISPGAYFGNNTNGLSSGVLPNPNLTWEKSLSYDGGLDATMFDNKLTISADIYYRHTYDILGSRQRSIPSTFGASLPDENYGVINTKGVELELGYKNTIGNDFRYYFSGNIGIATNKVILEDQPENQPEYKSILNYNTDRIFGYEAVGIIRTQQQLDALPAGYTIFGTKPELGMMNYKDQRGATSDNPDGVIDGNDQYYIAPHSIPPITYGASIGGSWKGITFNAQLQGSAGNDIMIDYRYVQAVTVERNFGFWNDHWTPQNPNAAFPRAASNNANPGSTFWLRNGSFLRLKNVELSYDIPKRFLRTKGSTSVRVFFVGTNLLLLEDHIKIRDPEAGGLDTYPLMKNYSFGLNISL